MEGLDVGNILKFRQRKNVPDGGKVYAKALLIKADVIIKILIKRDYASFLDFFILRVNS